MNDDDLIRRGDAVLAVTAADKEYLGANGAREFIRAIPADPVTNAGCCQPVKVKPLVWTETLDDRGDGTSEHNGGYEAESAFGVYEIGMGFGSDCYYWSATDPNLNEIGSFEDPIYAKAAAQADYEGRILAALEPAHHVNETPKSEHDSADVLATPPAPWVKDHAAPKETAK